MGPAFLQQRTMRQPRPAAPQLNVEHGVNVQEYIAALQDPEANMNADQINRGLQHYNGPQPPAPVQQQVIQMARDEQREEAEDNEHIDLGAGIGDNALADNVSVADSFSTAQANFVGNVVQGSALVQNNQQAEYQSAAGSGN